MRHALTCWSEIEGKMKPWGKVGLLMDYDGTLTPIVGRPDQARLNPEARKLLEALVNHRRFVVAIVTGRSLKDILHLVDIPGVYYMGNHGLETEGPDLSFLHPDACKVAPTIKALCRELRSKLAVRGIVVEDKGLTASMHYRLASKERAKKAKRILRGLVKLRENIKLTQGKKVLEVRPNLTWDKGEGVSWLLKALGGDILPIYMGDDKTDEDAFLRLKQGLTILVSSRRKKSNAKYYLKSVGEVHRFLRKLVEMP